MVKIIDTIWYDYDNMIRLHPKIFPTLDSIFYFLKSNPSIGIEIGEHSDSKGNDEFNLKVTTGHAHSMWEYLVGKGIDSFQVTYKGYGETRPLAPNEIDGKHNPQGRQLNRRIELVITSANKTD